MWSGSPSKPSLYKLDSQIFIPCFGLSTYLIKLFEIALNLPRTVYLFQSSRGSFKHNSQSPMHTESNLMLFHTKQQDIAEDATYYNESTWRWLHQMHVYRLLAIKLYLASFSYPFSRSFRHLFRDDYFEFARYTFLALRISGYWVLVWPMDIHLPNCTKHLFDLAWLGWRRCLVMVNGELWKSSSPIPHSKMTTQ